MKNNMSNLFFKLILISSAVADSIWIMCRNTHTLKMNKRVTYFPLPLVLALITPLCFDVLIPLPSKHWLASNWKWAQKRIKLPLSSVSASVAHTAVGCGYCAYLGRTALNEIELIWQVNWDPDWLQKAQPVPSVLTTPLTVRLAEN